jgi:hypothetical protein
MGLTLAAFMSLVSGAAAGRMLFTALSTKLEGAGAK